MVGVPGLQGPAGPIGLRVCIFASVCACLCMYILLHVHGCVCEVRMSGVLCLRD